MHENSFKCKREDVQNCNLTTLFVQRSHFHIGEEQSMERPNKCHPCGRNFTANSDFDKFTILMQMW